MESHYKVSGKGTFGVLFQLMGFMLEVGRHEFGNVFGEYLRLRDDAAEDAG